MARWFRPEQFAPGWVQGPSVTIPHTGTDDVLQLPQPKRSVVRVPGPERGQILIFTVLLADAEADRSTPPARSNDTRVGHLELPKGKSVWVFARAQPMTKEQEEWVTYLASDMKITWQDQRPDEVSGSVLSVGTDDGGRPFIWEIMMGERNVFVDQSAAGSQ
jgi:hypothetical protein